MNNLRYHIVGERENRVRIDTNIETVLTFHHQNLSRSDTHPTHATAGVHLT